MHFHPQVGFIVSDTARIFKQESSVGQAADWRIKELLGWVEAGNYGCTLKDLSFRLRISQRHLGRLFKRHTGITFHEYLRSSRLRKARSLLLDNGPSVKEIAARIGYRAASNFCNDFRRAFGVSPRSFRSASQSQPCVLN